MTLDCFSATSSMLKTPGPGAYGVDQNKTIGGALSLKYSIRPKYPQHEGYISKAPYVESRSSLSQIKYTIRPRYKSRDIEESPGPNFLPDPKEGFRKSVKIKNPYKTIDYNKVPGPGTYSPQPLKGTAVPAQGGRSAIVLDIIPDSPGPAAYDVPRVLSTTAPKFSIRPKTSVEKEDEPNPGYTFNNPGNLGSDSRKSTISRAQYGEDYSTISPGPGQYVIDGGTGIRPTSKIGPRIGNRFESKSADNFIAQKSTDSLYDTRQFPQIKQRTIASRCERRSDIAGRDVPGPNFLPDTSMDLRPLSIHLKIEVKNSQHTPGPSDYNPYNYENRTAHGFTVKGPAERTEWFTHDSSIPGPAQYKVDTKNDLPKWSIGEKSLPHHGRNANSRAQTSLGPRNEKRESSFDRKRMAQTVG